MILQHIYISSSLIRIVFFTYSEEVLLAKPTSQLKENSQYCTLYSKISNVTIIIYMYIPIASDVSPNVVFKKNSVLFCNPVKERYTFTELLVLA